MKSIIQRCLHSEKGQSYVGPLVVIGLILLLGTFLIVAEVITVK